MTASPITPATHTTLDASDAGGYVPQTVRTRAERLGEAKAEHVGVCLHQIDYIEVPELARERTRWSENNRRVISQLDWMFVSDPGWLGGLRSAKDAAELLDHGWPKGLERILAVRDRLIAELPKPQSIKRRPVWTDAGDELDLDRMRAGRLDQMWWVAKRAMGRAPRTVSIVAEIGGNCALTPDQMFWAGGAALILTDLLEAAGYRVELSAGWASFGHALPYRVNVQLVRLKEAREPLRSDVVAYAVSHAGFFRYWCLSMQGHHPSEVQAQCGRAVDLRDELAKLERAGRIAMPDVICSRVGDDRDVIRTVRQALADITGDASLALGGSGHAA